jgi:hypothetical protein
MSDDSADYKKSDSFKRNYAGTFVEKRQVKENKPINSETESAENEDDPLKTVNQFWSSFLAVGGLASDAEQPSPAK